MFFILRFNRLMQNFDRHRIFLNHSGKVSRSFFMFGPLSGVFLNIIHNIDKIRMPVEDQGSLNFGLIRISELRTSLYTIFTPPCL